jgi:DNA-binding MarR family transcriptional regulator
LQRDADRVLAVIRKHPDETQAAIRELAQIKNQRLTVVLDRLHSAGSIVSLPRAGKGGGVVWRCA